jgi:peptidoglycan/xylan/chitin deacetylase (PgdA/CDA1 family)
MLNKLLVWTLHLTCLHRVIWYFSKKRCITIISYHNPDPVTFEKHIIFLSSCYSFISLDELVQYLERREWGNLPSRPMILTIDDGYLSNHNLTAIIQKYRIPAMIYLTAGVIGTNRRFWWKSEGLTALENKKLKKMPDTERLILLESKYGHTNTRSYENISTLSWNDVREWIRAGGQIGCHSMFHPILTKCSKEKAIDEIMQSQLVISKALDLNCRHFAYPNGNWNDLVVSIVRTANYQTARTSRHGWVTLNSDRFTLPVMGVSDDANLCKVILQVTGIWQTFRTGKLPVFKKIKD